MKYLIVTLLIALLGVSTARAESLSWSSKALAAGTNTGINFTAGTNFSVALVFSANDAARSDTTKLLAISNKATGAQQSYAQGGVALDIRTNGDIYGRQFGQTNLYKGSPSLTFGTLQGSNVLGITVAFTANATNASNYDVTYTIYLNDARIYTTTHSSVSNDFDDFNYVRTGINNATFYYATGTADGDEFASLPEPTALALLALGVAGVALRRKLA